MIIYYMNIKLFLINRPKNFYVFFTDSFGDFFKFVIQWLIFNFLYFSVNSCRNYGYVDCKSTWSFQMEPFLQSWKCTPIRGFWQRCSTRCAIFFLNWFFHLNFFFRVVIMQLKLFRLHFYILNIVFLKPFFLRWTIILENDCIY